jgi:hypothetical protein
MKKLLITIAIIAISISLEAQTDSTSVNTQYSSDNTLPGSSTYKKSSWSIAINPSWPITHFKTYSNFGFGGYLGFEGRTSKNFGLTLNLGYIGYKGKTVDTIKYSNFNYIPLLAGAKLYMSKNFYLHGEAGAGFGTSGLGTSFWYGAGLGDKLGKSIDMELKYVGWHQNLVNSNTYNASGGATGGPAGGSGGSGGGGYGGHYSTIDLRIAFVF